MTRGSRRRTLQLVASTATLTNLTTSSSPSCLKTVNLATVQIKDMIKYHYHVVDFNRRVSAQESTVKVLV
jgi:hypothetical protein